MLNRASLRDIRSGKHLSQGYTFGETRIPRVMCSGNTHHWGTHITVTPAANLTNLLPNSLCSENWVKQGWRSGAAKVQQMPRQKSSKCRGKVQQMHRTYNFANFLVKIVKCTSIYIFFYLCVNSICINQIRFSNSVVTMVTLHLWPAIYRPQIAGAHLVVGLSITWCPYHCPCSARLPAHLPYASRLRTPFMFLPICYSPYLLPPLSCSYFQPLPLLFLAVNLV